VAGDQQLIQRPHRRQVLGGLTGAGLAAAAGVAQARPPGLNLSGKYEQSGFAIGLTAPRAGVLVDSQPVVTASTSGYFVVGFDRDAPAQAAITVQNGDGSVVHELPIAPGVYDIQRIDGLPQDTVTPTAPALLARIAAEAARKRIGFASNIDADYFKDGFILPVQATRISGSFGGQRVLNGVPATPHYGYDMAAPVGTPIHAPGAGMVSFAETGLHYEGGLVMIDHGQGLVTCYLHMSKVDVVVGQRLAQGEPIGAVGMEGRATGPHLCWRMKWRARNLNPDLMVGAKAPRAV
jgi:murein DD-endopeptidase MepM/ murein hydrolase activator NlpD